MVWGGGGDVEVFLSYGTPYFRLGYISQDHLTTFPQRAGDLQLLLTTPVETIRICEKVFFHRKARFVLHFMLWLFLGITDTEKILLEKHPVATRSSKELADLA